MAPPIPRLFSLLYGCRTPPSRKLNYALGNRINNTVPISIAYARQISSRFRRHGRIKQPINALNRQITATSCTYPSGKQKTLPLALRQRERGVTIMKRNRSRESEIEPETSGLQGSVQTFRTPGQLTIELL